MLTNRTIFIPIFTQAESKNLLLSDVLPLLSREPGVRLVIFTQERKVELYRRLFGTENVSIEPMEDLQYERGVVAQFWSTLSYNSIPTRTVWMRQNRIVALNPSLGQYALLPLKKVVWLLGHLRLWREFLRAVSPLFREDTLWDKPFETYRPSLVFATNMIHGNSIALIKAARRRGIPAVGMTKSWDNLTSKTLFRVKPDVLLVNNPHIKKEAVAIGDMPPERIEVVGLPQYDHYYDESWRLPRDAFFKLFRMDPNKKLITYFMGGPLAVHDPRDHIAMLSRAIEAGELPPATILLRTHPNYDVSVDELASLPHVRLSKPGTGIGGSGKDREFDQEDVRILISTLYYSDVTVNTGSTMTIEATIFDKPIVLVGFDGYTLKPHYESVAHTMDITHYRYMLKSGAARRVESEQSLINAVRAYIEDPSRDAEGRKKLFNEQVWRVGGSSRALAQALLAHLPH